MDGQVLGQPGSDGSFGLVDPDPRLQTQVDAIDPTQTPEEPLGGRDVHQGKGPVQSPGRPPVQKQAANRQPFPAIPHGQVQAGAGVQAVPAGKLLRQHNRAGVAE